MATLRERFADTNVEVLQGDATDMPFEEGSFDSVGCFTMLHHVPTAALQNQVFAEALRVLRPGGTMIASDSLPSTDLHDFHVDDVYNPIDPASLLTRLQAVGFGAITISVDYAFTFRARKPDAKTDDWHPRVRVWRLIGLPGRASGTMTGRCHSSTVSPPTPDPDVLFDVFETLGRRAGADALPGAGGGADRAGQRRQRHPVHADRHREEPGRHRRALRGAGAGEADVLHRADQGAGLGEVLRADRRLRRRERRHADRRRGGQLPGADRLLHRRGAGQHRAARGGRRPTSARW